MTFVMRMPLYTLQENRFNFSPAIKLAVHAVNEIRKMLARRHYKTRKGHSEQRTFRNLDYWAQ